MMLMLIVNSMNQDGAYSRSTGEIQPFAGAFVQSISYVALSIHSIVLQPRH
jgi:hypothetical protein